MKSFDDKKASGKKPPWDEEVVYHEITATEHNFRPVGTIQDLMQYWVIPDAAAYADEIKRNRSLARKRGVEPKAIRRPPGFPVMCPRFDPYREVLVDYIDPITKAGYKSGEVLTAKDLQRSGIPIPSDIMAALKVLKNPTATTSAKKRARCIVSTTRFARRSLDLGKAIALAPVSDPLYEDFKARAPRRTMFYAIDRKRQAKRGGRLTEEMVGVVNRGGVPYTAWQAMERLSRAVKSNPFANEGGWDVCITMDKSQRPDQMWSVIHVTQNDLTREEIAIVYGKYKLSDGTTVGLDTITSMRQTAKEVDSDGKPTRDATKAKGLLRKYKTLRPAAIAPLDEMIASSIISGEELKETLVRCGYYDEEGLPRPELIEEDTQTKGKKSGWDNEEDDEEDRDDGDEEDAPARKPKRSKISKEKGSANTKKSAVDSGRKTRIPQAARKRTLLD